MFTRAQEEGETGRDTVRARGRKEGWAKVALFHLLFSSHPLHLPVSLLFISCVRFFLYFVSSLLFSPSFSFNCFSLTPPLALSHFLLYESPLTPYKYERTWRSVASLTFDTFHLQHCHFFPFTVSQIQIQWESRHSDTQLPATKPWTASECFTFLSTTVSRQFNSHFDRGVCTLLLVNARYQVWVFYFNFLYSLSPLSLKVESDAKWWREREESLCISAWESAIIIDENGVRKGKEERRRDREGERERKREVTEVEKAEPLWVKNRFCVYNKSSICMYVLWMLQVKCKWKTRGVSQAEKLDRQ